MLIVTTYLDGEEPIAGSECPECHAGTLTNTVIHNRDEVQTIDGSSDVIDRWAVLRCSWCGRIYASESIHRTTPAPTQARLEVA